MKQKLVDITRKQLQNRGLLYKRYPTIKHIFDKIKTLPLAVQRYELQELADTLKKTNNHKIYNSLLSEFIPCWSPHIQKEKFIGKGVGGSSLNTYRKVQIRETAYFEKIFFSDDENLLRLRWFYTLFYRRFKEFLNIPKIEMNYNAELLSIVYYEFMELPSQACEEDLLHFLQTLHCISVGMNFETMSIPKNLKDFESNHPVYQKNRSIAKEKLQVRQVNISVIEEKMKSSSLIVAHGDIHFKNAFKKKYLIDWDDFGLYPMGFDAALTYYYLLKRQEVDKDIEGWLVKHFDKVVKKGKWKEFKGNVFYFLYVFGQKILFSQGKYTALENKLLKTIDDSL